MVGCRKPLTKYKMCWLVPKSEHSGESVIKWFDEDWETTEEETISVRCGDTQGAWWCYVVCEKCSLQWQW
jgi:hypothetical protein